MKKIFFIPILLFFTASFGQIVDKNFGTRTYNVNTFQTRWTNGTDTLFSLYMDQLKSFKIVNYSGNFGASYTARTLTDKNYVDSAIAAAGGSATTIYNGDGSLSGNRTVTGAGNTLTWTGTQASLSAFNVNNTGNGGAGSFSTTGTGTALTGSNSSSGNGILASSSSGNGIRATSTSGRAALLKVTPTSTNTIVHPLVTIRGSSGTPAAGLGGGLDMQLTDAGGNDATAASIFPVFTSATAGATSTEMHSTIVTAGSSAVKSKLTAGGTLVRNTATNFASVGGKIYETGSDGANVTTGETDLYSITLNANQLGADGEEIIAKYAGIYFGSTSNKELKVYFGGTQIFASTALAVAITSSWEVNVQVKRVNSTTVRCTVNLLAPSGATVVHQNYTEVGSLDFTTTNIIKITGQASSTGAASNDIILRMGTLWWYPGLILN